MNTIQLIELITGDLMIVLNDKEELQELKLKLNENEITAELLELLRYTGNDWYCNQVIGLTEADNICKGAKYFNSLPNEYFESYVHYIQRLTELNAEYIPMSFNQFVIRECNVGTDKPIDFEKIWYYPHYMVKKYTDELLRDGFVIFKLAE